MNTSQDRSPAFATKVASRLHSAWQHLPLPSPLLGRLALGLALTAMSLIMISSMLARFSLAQAWDQTSPSTQPANLPTVPVRAWDQATQLSVDGVVEAVRFAQIAPQVAGVITQLPVQAGDRVKAGQLLLRLDARAAQQAALAGQSQVEVAKAALEVAEKEYQRQKRLFEQNFISQAQLDRAKAQWQSSSAQAKAQMAQAAALQTQSGFYTMSAPFDGVVAYMPSSVGEMAMPGKLLMTVVDPRQMRVMVNLPAARLASLQAQQQKRIEFPNLPPAQRYVNATNMTILPVSDVHTHTVQIRFDLPADITGVTPGMFARVNLSFNEDQSQHAVAPTATRLFVPKRAIFRRAELFAVYVQNKQGQAILRQVKLGPVHGDEQEILSGVSVGELLVLDPLKNLHAAQTIVNSAK